MCAHASRGRTQAHTMTDNASKLQAMQDAATDAGNDVRALKVSIAMNYVLNLQSLTH